MARRRDVLAGAGGAALAAAAWGAGPGARPALGAAAGAEAAAASDGAAWDAVREQLFGDRELGDGAGTLRLEAPARAHDAALVPISIAPAAPDGAGPRIGRVWLVIDENPAPVAGAFAFPAAGGARPGIETRVRVNQYTTVRAVAETADGRLWAVDRYVKAAGGCSAPALKDPALAEARVGRMKLKPLGAFAAGQPLKVQLLVSHPQYTGMQIDQVSRNWIPPDYIQKIAVGFAGRPVLAVDADISLSEDPSLTFAFVPEAPGELVAEVEDSRGRRFRQAWPLGPDV